MKTRSCAVLLVLCGVTLATAADKADKADAPQKVKHQITGLFSPDREQDLRAACEKLTQVKLVSVDYKNAEATFEYDPARVFPKAKPDEVVKNLDAKLKVASNFTLGVKPLRTTPLDKLKVVEIPVAGLDCKACSLAAYEAVAKLDGVEWATVDFRAGRVAALLDPEKTERAKLEAALKKLGVQVNVP